MHSLMTKYISFKQRGRIHGFDEYWNQIQITMHPTIQHMVVRSKAFGTLNHNYERRGADLKVKCPTTQTLLITDEQLQHQSEWVDGAGVGLYSHHPISKVRRVAHHSV